MDPAGLRGGGLTSTEYDAPANSSSSSDSVFSLSLTWSTESWRTLILNGGFSTETIFRISQAVYVVNTIWVRGHLFRRYWTELGDLVDYVSYSTCRGILVIIKLWNKDHLVRKNAKLIQTRKLGVHGIDWRLNNGDLYIER